jgi:hypothetical protein
VFCFVPVIVIYFLSRVIDLVLWLSFRVLISHKLPNRESQLFPAVPDKRQQALVLPFKHVKMKLIRTTLFTVVVFVISMLVDGAQSDQDEQDYTGSELKTLPPDDIVRVMVMHKNDEGKKEAANAASTIVGEIPRFNILVATMSVHNADGLRHSPNIEGVDLDKGVKVAPRQELYEENLYLVRRVSMVQADTTVPGPDAIKICIVDT